MGAGNQHILATQLNNALGTLGQIGIVLFIILILDQPARFQTVRCQDSRLRQQQLAHRIQHILIGQLITAPRTEHRIKHQRNVGVI